MADMEVELVAPDRIVWSGEAEFVLARTSEGDIGILPNHEPMLGVLVEHPVKVKRSGEDELVVAVLGGFLSVTRDRVSILAESVEMPDEIDASAARSEYEEARSGDDDEDKAKARRAAARLRAVGETV
jgi:F-type H+-transporting ATPase subunit epsilon